MLVNVNVIYYVHVGEQACWACSAGSSAIENLCIIIFIITILPFHQPTHHPAIPPANTLSCHSTSWHTTQPFHQPSCHSISQHLTQPFHQPTPHLVIPPADTPPSHHTTQPFYQLTHHPVTTPPSHSISWHTTQPPHPSTSWHMTQPFHQPPNHLPFQPPTHQKWRSTAAHPVDCGVLLGEPALGWGFGWDLGVACTRGRGEGALEDRGVLWDDPLERPPALAERGS